MTNVIAEATELLKNAEYADGLATVLTQDCEALEVAVANATEVAVANATEVADLAPKTVAGSPRLEAMAQAADAKRKPATAEELVAYYRPAGARDVGLFDAEGISVRLYKNVPGNCVEGVRWVLALAGDDYEGYSIEDRPHDQPSCSR